MSESSVGKKKIGTTAGNVRNMEGFLTLDQQTYTVTGLLKHSYNSLIILITAFGLASLVSQGL